MVASLFFLQILTIQIVSIAAVFRVRPHVSLPTRLRGRLGYCVKCVLVSMGQWLRVVTTRVDYIPTVPMCVLKLLGSDWSFGWERMRRAGMDGRAGSERSLPSPPTYTSYIGVFSSENSGAVALLQKRRFSRENGRGFTRVFFFNRDHSL